jgi:hypothetical protein
MSGQLPLTYIKIIIIIIVTIVISLVNSAVSISDYIASDDRISDNEYSVGRMWRETIVASSEVGHYPDICLQELKRTMKILGRISGLQAEI